MEEKYKYLESKSLSELIEIIDNFIFTIHVKDEEKK